MTLDGMRWLCWTETLDVVTVGKQVDNANKGQVWRSHGARLGWKTVVRRDATVTQVTDETQTNVPELRVKMNLEDLSKNMSLTS